MMDTALRILIVDDMRDGADTLATLLRLQLSCQVATAYSGEEAVAEVSAAAGFKPNVVITDLTMPGMNGVDTARMIRRTLAATPPLVLLMTADPAVREELDELNTVFDHAFAKPVDLDRLAELLQAHAQSLAPAPTALAGDATEFFELLTDAVRQVVPRVKAREQTLSFDCRGPRLLLPQGSAALGRDIDRLVTHAVDAVLRGFVTITGEVQRTDTGDFELTITAAGTGRLCSDADATDMIGQLRLVEQGQPGATAARVAQGVCGDTGATLTLKMNRSDGLLLRWRLLCGAAQCEAIEDDACAANAMAWLVDAQGDGVGGLVARLQRMGWQLRCMASCAQALDGLLHPLPSDAEPALLVVLDGDASAPELYPALLSALPPSTQLVMATTLALDGRASLGPWASAHARSYPFSAGDLAQFTAAACAGVAARTPTAPTGAAAEPPTHGSAVGQAVSPAPSGPEARRRSVLLVDDNEVNRVVGRALLETLGYEVVTCSDGLDAIAQCGKAAPDVVLIDIDMQVLDGYEATRRLRSLQRAGRLPGFSILACTSQDHDASLYQEVGLDGHLAKPLDRRRLAAVLSIAMAG